MRKRWKNWLTRPTRWKKPGRGPSRREPRHRPLVIQQIEDRLMLSAVVPSVQAQGGFIDLSGGYLSASTGVVLIVESPDRSFLSMDGTGITGITLQSDGLQVRYPTLVPIPRAEFTAAPSEGGMIDLTLARREFIFDQSNRALQRWTGTENVAPASADAGETIVARPTPAGTEPEISSAVVLQAALPGSLLPGSPLPNEPIRVSFSVPALQRIDGSRGRSRAFELAIGFPAATARDEYFTHTERFLSDASFRDKWTEPTDSVGETSEAAPSEEPEEEPDPARREDALDRLDAKGPGSEQEVEPGGATSAGVGAAHRGAVFAEMASTESDVLLPGVFLNKKRSVEVASVLTAVAVGHYLATRQRQQSDTHPRRIWLPSRRRPF